MLKNANTLAIIGNFYRFSSHDARVISASSFHIAHASPMGIIALRLLLHAFEWYCRCHVYDAATIFTMMPHTTGILMRARNYSSPLPTALFTTSHFSAFSYIYYFSRIFTILGRLDYSDNGFSLQVPSALILLSYNNRALLLSPRHAIFPQAPRYYHYTRISFGFVIAELFHRRHTTRTTILWFRQHFVAALRHYYIDAIIFIEYL